MKEPDPQLRALLQQWRDIEPSAQFDAGVRRRIRLATAPTLRPSWVGAWLWRPEFVAAAVAISIVIGSLTGLRTRPSQPVAELEFMAPTTLAGGYARLSAGGLQ